MSKQHVFPVVLAGLLLIGCAPSKPVEPTMQTRQLLGTICNVSIFDTAPAGVFEKVFERVRQVEDKMSPNIAASELSAVNDRAGLAPVKVSAETFSLIQRALAYSESSGGVFDISVGPLVKLWGIGTDAARLPRPEEIKARLGLVNYRFIKTDPADSTVFLEKPGMSLDLGAIAKHWALDMAAQVLKDSGVKSAIFDFGGDILLVGRKPNGQAWRIAYRIPRMLVEPASAS
jgi:FAD:protein FMN transferase